MQETRTVCSHCCKMMPLCWSTLLLCLSVSAGNKVESGRSVTMECSSAGCHSSIEGYAAMYLYKDFKEREEVLYYYKNEKVTPRPRYKDRIQTNGSLWKHTITISNLTVDDTGFYRCVYKRMESDEVQCNVYTLLVIGHQLSYVPPAVRRVPIRAEPSEGGVICTPEDVLPPLPSGHQVSYVPPAVTHVPIRTEPSEGGVIRTPEELLSLLPSAPCAIASEKSPPLVIIIIATVTITVLLTTIFIVLILPKVKRWTGSRRRLSQVSNDYVYEVMTKNGLRPLAAPQPSPPSLYDLA